MVTFLAAVAFICFKVTDKVEPAVYSVAWAFVSTLIIWTIVTGWEAKSGFKFTIALRRVLSLFSRRSTASNHERQEEEAEDEKVFSDVTSDSKVSMSADLPWKRRVFRKLLQRKRPSEKSR